MWSLRNIYLYLVCFVSIMLIITGIISTISAVSDILLPEQFDQGITMAEPTKELGMSKEQYVEMMQKQALQNSTNQKNRNIKSAIRSLSMIVVAIPFYMYHWKKIQSDLPAINKVEA